MRSRFGHLRSDVLRNKHCVDHMDHAVVRFDVGLDDLGFVDHHAGLGLDCNRATLDGFDLSAILQLDDISRQHFAGDYMIGQNGCQSRFIFQQRLQFLRWNLLERCVGRGEEREGACAFESVDQTGGFDCGHECAEVGVLGGDVDDVIGIGTYGTGEH